MSELYLVERTAAPLVNDSYSLTNIDSSSINILESVKPSDASDKHLPNLQITKNNHERLVQGELPEQSTVPPLFEHSDHPRKDINAANVVMGELNDCYFMAPLAAVAQQRPELIINMIKNNSDGTYTVTFPGDAAHPVAGLKPPQWDDLKKDARYGGGMWAHLIETAHKKYTGKWSNKRETGEDMESSIHLLTNESATWKQFNVNGLQDVSISLEDLKKLLKSVQSDKRVVVAGSMKGSAPPNGTVPPTVLIPKHGYTVLGYKETIAYDKELGYPTRRHMVKLRNPLGTGPNNGVFEMSVKDFQDQFLCICFSEK